MTRRRPALRRIGVDTCHPIRLPPLLTDGVVLLDEHQLADAAADLAGEDDEIRRRFDGGRPATLAEAEDAIRRYQARRVAEGPEVTYALRLADATLIGGVEIRRPTAAAADVGYWVFPAFRGRGYARRALTLLCEAVAREIDGLVEISAHIEPDNVASLRTAAAVGFRETGSVVENGVERLRLVRRL
jgi:RimJ/RimL family protein N-acetyltransferase